MSDFLRIKSAVDEQRRLQTQGETRMKFLDEEKTRILSDISTETGKTISTKEEAQSVADTTKSDIETQIISAKEILDKEGVAY